MPAERRTTFCDALVCLVLLVTLKKQLCCEKLTSIYTTYSPVAAESRAETAPLFPHSRMIPLRDCVVVLAACARLGSRALSAFRRAEDHTGLESVLHLSRSLGRRGGAGAGEAYCHVCLRVHSYTRAFICFLASAHTSWRSQPHIY